ncbi:RsmB/NOP family class I SAM-dependent RNA methyltransferase [Bdellovibrio sp. HCB337]|uniref:RsmB/NOP family class I SAM-dependent RNA methyltransferase n=1 Tax=Bdellovibrio sp. HCB337 TaxID=3394358 RepID=UPI0039A50277
MKETFYQHFEKIYGTRWGDLFDALKTSERQVARLNRLSSAEPPLLEDATKSHPSLQDCFWIPPQAFFQPERTSEELLNVYVMDPASVIVARALEVQDGDRLLDMCAAPGGKSLILIEGIPTSGEIFANDLSPERRERLKKVIQQYVPRTIRDRVWVTGKDGVQFGLKEPDSFDRVLLDAPCSGERHVLENKKAMEEWSPRRGENLATRQYSLLSAALLAVKSGGRIVYSTCSINPDENDGVIHKLLKKKKDQVKLIPQETYQVGEKTEYGVAFLPDRCGFGPLYYAVIEKV